MLATVVRLGRGRSPRDSPAMCLARSGASHAPHAEIGHSTQERHLATYVDLRGAIDFRCTIAHTCDLVARIRVL